MKFDGREKLEKVELKQSQQRQGKVKEELNESWNRAKEKLNKSRAQRLITWVTLQLRGNRVGRQGGLHYTGFGFCLALLVERKLTLRQGNHGRKRNQSCRSLLA